MIEKYVTSAWSAVAPGLGNHLWQSTLVALMAGLLTLALRKHHARSRYWLWLAASLKFLVPFSLLVELGQPFSQSAIRVSSTPNPSIASSSLAHFLPFVAVLWLCGLLAVVLVWT